MIRLAPATLAAASFAVPLLVASDGVVVAIGAVGVLLATLGLIASWRWPFTGAACAFLLQYMVALLLAGSAPPIALSVGCGFAIFLLLQSADLADRTRRAAADLTVLRGQLGGWLALGGAVAAAALLGVALAVALAPSLPAAASPFLAAAGALGIVASLAAMIVHAARRAPRAPSARSAR